MSQTKCTSLPCTATKEELRLSHKQKMARKAARQFQARKYNVKANLSRNHKDYGSHPSFTQ